MSFLFVLLLLLLRKCYALCGCGYIKLLSLSVCLFLSFSNLRCAYIRGPFCASFDCEDHKYIKYGSDIISFSCILYLAIYLFLYHSQPLLPYVCMCYACILGQKSPFALSPSLLFLFNPSFPFPSHSFLHFL